MDNEQETVKVCNTCDKPEGEVKFEGTRKKCNICRGKRQTENIKNKSDNGETKKCTKCGTINLVNKFHGNVCETCHRNKNTENNQNKVAHTDDGGRQIAIDNPSKHSDCNHCNKKFDKDLFKYDIQKCVFISTCKECFNKRKYYEKWRQKMRKTDLEGYLRHNAKIQKEYLDKHPEKRLEMNEKQKIDINVKIKGVIKSAKQRNIYFEQNDIEKLKEKLTFNCGYCGYLHYKYLNGLDRLDNNIGYTDDNCIPCCRTCNFMKQDYTFEILINKLEQIYDFMENYKCFEVDEYYRPYTNFGCGKKIENKNKDLSKKDEKYIKSQFKQSTCFYCNHSDLIINLGIDRIDSNKSYYIENCVPCCSMCNYMKKDLIQEDFVRHVRKIISHFAKIYEEDKIEKTEKTEKEFKEKINNINLKKIENKQEKMQEKNTEETIEDLKKQNEDLKKQNEMLKHNINEIDNEEKTQKNAYVINERHIPVILRNKQNVIVAKSRNLAEMGNFLYYKNLNKNKFTDGNKGAVRKDYIIEKINLSDYNSIVVDKEAHKIAEQDLLKYKIEQENVQKNTKTSYSFTCDNKNYTSARELAKDVGCSDANIRLKYKECIQKNLKEFKVGEHTVIIN